MGALVLARGGVRRGDPCMNKRGRMLQLVASTPDEDSASTTPASPLRRTHPTRWTTDGLNLKNAFTSTHEASAHLLEAFRFHGFDSARSKQLLDYALDQAALATNMLTEFLRRHGRTAERVTVDDSAPADEQEYRRKRAKNSESKSRSAAKRYAELKAKGLCVKCGLVAKDGERVHCTGCRKKITDVAAKMKGDPR